jgi:hypothetical protein
VSRRSPSHPDQDTWVSMSQPSPSHHDQDSWASMSQDPLRYGLMLPSNMAKHVSRTTSPVLVSTSLALSSSPGALEMRVEILATSFTKDITRRTHQLQQKNCHPKSFKKYKPPTFTLQATMPSTMPPNVASTSHLQTPTEEPASGDTMIDLPFRLK